MYPKLAGNPAVIAVVFGAYFALGQLGQSHSPLPTAAAVWPPSGLALAAMLLFGQGIWIAIMAGALAVHVTSNGYVLLSMVLATAETLEAVIGAALVERFANGVDVFRSARATLRFAALMGLVSTTVSASWGSMAVALSVPGESIAFSDIWMTWWLGHYAGILIGTPFLLAWATTAVTRPKATQALEGVSLFALLAVVGLVVFGGLFPSDIKNYPLEFLCVPLLIWAAFRFGPREVATAIVLLSVIAVWGTNEAFGPFVQSTPNESLVLLQAYLSVMVIMGVVLGAVVLERRLAEGRLRELAITDPLTGLANYRRLLEVLRAEIARTGRTSRDFTVLFLDVDRLKAINDRYGHLVGSRALCRVGEALRRTCRSIDTPSRYGGDEFAIVLPETTEAGGRQLLERISRRLAADPNTPPVSVSGGVAVYPRDGHSPTLLLRAADVALYQAKRERHRSDPSHSGEAPEQRTGTLV